MALEPGTTLLHYRITGKIGEGGMGTVYRATDTKLEREVALKVLPREMAEDPRRLERFQREARAVAALSHPHIVMLFSVEQEGDTHFLTMELIEGESLDRILAPGGLALARVFDIGIALADALAAAHEKGVVHRDLKPGNVMIGRDGRVKVLDFGLAKLAAEAEAASEGGDPAVTAAATAALTQEGTVMGTAPYMSPEQLEGKAVDHRTDIFSLGVMLYELCSGTRPFQGDSSASLISSILRDTPRLANEVRTDIPRHLARIVDHCLQKRVTDRYQSALDVRNALRGLRREVESEERTSSGEHSVASPPPPGSAGAPVESGPTTTPPPSVAGTSGPASGAAIAARRGGARFVWPVLGLLAAVALAVALYTAFVRPAREAPTEAFRDVRLSTLMSRNDLELATLSPDGRYLAYVTSDPPTYSLTVRQVSTGSDITIVADSPRLLRGIRFSPDGDYLYFLNRDPELPNYSALFRVPSLGGDPLKIAFDVDTAPSFAPDARRFVFRRGLIEQSADSLVIASLDDDEEHELLRVESSRSFQGEPVWSPDGRHVAIGVQTTEGGFRAWVEAVEVETGRSDPVGEKTWLNIDSLAWGLGGKSLVVVAFEFGTGLAPQVYSLAFPEGSAFRVTNDLDGYRNLSVSGDGRTLAVVRGSEVRNLWVAPAGGEPAAITNASGSSDSVLEVEPLAGGKLMFAAPRDGKVFVWSMGADGSNRRQVTREGVFAFALDAEPEVGAVYAQAVEEAVAVVPHIWRILPDESVVPLTKGSGEVVLDLSPTGNAILFREMARAERIQVLQLDGGETRVLIERALVDAPFFSYDGQRVLATHLEGEEGSFYPQRYVYPVAGGDPLMSFRLPPGAVGLAWVPGVEALTYVDRQAGWNLMRRSIPDGEPRPLTDFRNGRIIGHRWHRDGSRIMLHHRAGSTDSLWQLEVATGELREITEFKTGRIAEVHWAPDSYDVYFLHGTSSREVVLIREAE